MNKNISQNFQNEKIETYFDKKPKEPFYFSLTTITPSNWFLSTFSSFSTNHYFTSPHQNPSPPPHYPIPLTHTFQSLSTWYRNNYNQDKVPQKGTGLMIFFDFRHHRSCCKSFCQSMFENPFLAFVRSIIIEIPMYKQSLFWPKGNNS